MCSPLLRFPVHNWKPWFSHFWLAASPLGSLRSYGTWWFISNPKIGSLLSPCSTMRLLWFFPKHAGRVLIDPCSWTCSSRQKEIPGPLAPTIVSRLFLIVCVSRIRAIFSIPPCLLPKTKPSQHENSLKLENTLLCQQTENQMPYLNTEWSLGQSI